MESNAESEWWLSESGLDSEKIDLKIKGTTAKSIKNNLVENGLALKPLNLMKKFI